MAMSSGTATDFLDLYKKIRAFLLDGVAGAGWLPVLSGQPFTDSIGIRNLRCTETDKWNAFDNTSANYLRIALTAPLDIQFFESQTIASIKLTTPMTSGGYTLYSPKDVSCYTSADGTSWTLSTSWIGLPQFTDGETRTLTLAAPVTTSWIRLAFTAGYTALVDVAEIQFFNGSGVRIHVNLDSTIGAKVVLKSPVTASGVSAHVKMFLYCRPDDDMFQIGFTGAADVQQETDIYLGFPNCNYINESPTHYAHFWDSSMPYWFYGNERFFYGFVKVGSTYRQFGFGYLLPYATPTQYPLPMFVGAESNLAAIWSDANERDIRGFTNPSRISLSVFTARNGWAAMGNYYESGGTEIQSPLASGELWPGSLTQHKSMVNGVGTDGTNGNYGLYPLIALTATDSIWGELPNIYSVPNRAATSEDTVTIGGDTYRVFQNIWRTNRYDYCAIKEE